MAFGIGRAKLRATIGLLGFIKRRPSTEETVKEFFVRHLGMFCLFFITVVSLRL